MSVLDSIDQPVLLLNEAIARENLKRMADKVAAAGVRFRPHFKTHQSAEIGEWFKDFGVQKITVSSVEMAEYFADAGWQDILIAFSVNIRQIARLQALAQRIHLSVLVENEEAVTALAGLADVHLDVWVKVDVGNHRTGIPIGEHAAICALAGEMRGSRLSFRGLLTHAGQTYHAGSPAAIIQIFQEMREHMARAREALRQAGFSRAELSFGDTPGCTLVEDWSGFDEARPGNFVFYDLTQHFLGVCAEEEMAVALACPVVAKHNEDGLHRIILHGGAVHLSKEWMAWEGRPSYGMLAPLHAGGWGPLMPGSTLYELSQEHGIAQVTSEQYDQIRVGDLLAVLPVHSCLAVDLFHRYLTTAGEWIGLKDREPLGS